MRFLQVSVIVVLFAALGGGAQAQVALTGQPHTAYVAPGRLFAVELPDGWGPFTSAEEPDLVEIRRTERPGTAWLQIRRLPVSDNARPRQLLVRAVETRLKHLAHFDELQRRDLDVNGLKGASILGTYWYQGNVQYPRAFEEVYLIAGKDAFVFHFECFEPLSGSLADDVNKMYGTFVPRPPANAPVPSAPAEDPLDKIPF